MNSPEASKGKRFLTFLIDVIVIYFLVLLTVYLEHKFHHKVYPEILRWIIGLGGYYIPFEFYTGKTLGKYLTNTRAVNANGDRISFKEAMIRYYTRLIPFEFLSLASGDETRAWHDTLSNTFVIDEDGEGKEDVLDVDV